MAAPSAMPLSPPATDFEADGVLSFPIANPDKPQAACVLLLDTSRSMRGAPLPCRTASNPTGRSSPATRRPA